MNTRMRFLNIILALGLLVGMLSGCKPAPSKVPRMGYKDVLYVNLTWHQHQPIYYKNEAGIYSRPWVRVHATKDYLDMAETVAKYEDVHITFNLTPSLIRQLDDFANNGVKDLYWVYAEVPADQLDETQKRFILERFFDANWDHIISIYPRYQELLDKRGGTDSAAIDAALTSFTEQDFRDLQIWFNLAWVDPDYLAVEPLKDLVEKGRDFSEEDKTILFDEILSLVQKVIPYHAELQKDGVIEVTTTPYAHPILPLIYNSDLALVGNPSAETPAETFSYPQDAAYHLEKSVEMYKEYFGMDVRGLWPGEGSVAQDIVGLVSEAGYQWMQTGEPVLAKSLGIETFTRDDNEMVQEADDLYRPYYVKDAEGNQVAIFFRDWTLSDKIGFTYSGMEGAGAAQDLVTRLENIQSKFVADGTEGPHIVSIIVDGENAWENYDNDGKAFLNTLYQLLGESEALKTVTPSEYLEMFPEQRSIDNLFPGAWFSANYDTWYGESEEALAWNYLGEVRDFLSAYETGEKSGDADCLATAFDFMYLAEGSDWFWWYGADQDSGQDSYFDEGFRELLKQVYLSMGEEVPVFVNVPIIQPQAVQANTPMMGSGTPEIDGKVEDEAWDWAAYYEGTKEGAIEGLYFVLDKENLHIRLDTTAALADGQMAEFYMSIPGQDGRNTFGMAEDQLLGISATLMFAFKAGGTSLDIYDTDGETWTLLETEAGAAAQDGKSIEVSLPLAKLGKLNSGDELKLVTVLSPDGVKFPQAGPAAIQILDIGEATSLLLVEDPLGDDYGPGTYTYPTDGVFGEGVFDIATFEISYDAASLILTLSLDGVIENGWGSPNGFSVQTFDVYIDKDPGSGSGARMLLPGRNAALSAENGWEYTIWVEGWAPQVVIPDAETMEPKDYSEASSAMKLFVDPGKNAIIVRVPLTFLGEGDPATWGYAAVLLGQEGYPATGVWRVRDVSQEAAQYKFGGAALDNNHSRIIDMAWPEENTPDQKGTLGGYPSSAKAMDTLTPDDFAIIPLLNVK
jgi:alpha-amylase/alpha-mannosidase (GH57 family)